MARVRVIAVHVTVQAVADDGDHLTPLDVQSLVIPFAQWEAFSQGGVERAVAALQQQLDSATDD